MRAGSAMAWKRSGGSIPLSSTAPPQVRGLGSVPGSFRVQVERRPVPSRAPVHAPVRVAAPRTTTTIRSTLARAVNTRTGSQARKDSRHTSASRLLSQWHPVGRSSDPSKRRASPRRVSVRSYRTLRPSAVATTRPQQRRHARWFERFARVVPTSSASAAGYAGPSRSRTRTRRRIGSASALPTRPSVPRSIADATATPEQYSQE
jgi:hypothetical protein